MIKLGLGVCGFSRTDRTRLTNCRHHPDASVIRNIFRAIASNLAKPNSAIGLPIGIVMARKLKNFSPIHLHVSYIEEC